MARKRKHPLRKRTEQWVETLQSCREIGLSQIRRKSFRKANHSFWVLCLVLVGGLWGAIDWAANRWASSTPEKAAPPVSAPAKDPLSESPWSFFHPSWKEEGWLTRALISNPSNLQNSASKVRALVSDPEGKIEPEFQVPESLKSRVAFWMEIYARYNSRMRVVHDRVDPGIIYGYIDFRPIYRAMGNTAQGDVKANELERKILKELRLRLEDAAGLTTIVGSDAAEKGQIQNMLSRFGAIGKKEAREIISRIRTQSGQADMFLAALFRAKQLLPHIESVFRRQNLPVGLGRIPFVESSFNSRAYSKGGAMGIWQFMPETAREMIHRDEEKNWADPLKQTASAARLLKMYRSVLPDWGSTVTSYNSGVGRVRRILTKHKLKNVEELLSVEDDDGLGFAGKNFYSEFLAANLVEAYKEILFDKLLEGADAALVFKGVTAPFPKDFCDM